MMIDERDAAIIEALRRDARASNAEISRSVGVSEGTIRRRLNRLLNERVIQIRATFAEPPSDAPSPDAAFGALIEITVQPGSLDAVLERVSALDETGFVVCVSGDCDIIARIEAQNYDALRRFLAERIRPIPGIERTETKIILTAAKDEAKN